MLIRSFIALYPDPAAREEMARFVSCLRQKERGVRWEQTDKIHVTMKFLGDMEPKTLDAIAAGLAAGIPALPLSQKGIPGRIDRTGGFPNLRRPRIVWLGFSTPPPAVLALQQLVEEVCMGEGVEPEEKAFTPHFTIGRVRRDADTDGLENALQACSFQPSPVRFTRLCIMESTLTPQGAIHKERIHFSLTPGE
ncbi:MAG: RNA 2',3'-cyclic phosphodiesterase [Bacteroidetes bacterium]|nr:RNA 2',3'-cyclic phosphodiesterase [Bacteroidota bacterium]